MKTSFIGFAISPLAYDPSERRQDRADLKAAKIDGKFRSELVAQLELQMSGLDESRFFVSKSYAVAGVL